MTLFGPKSIYSELQTKEGVMGVFRKYFPDAIELIEEERIIELCLGKMTKSHHASVSHDHYLFFHFII